MWTGTRLPRLFHASFVGLKSSSVDNNLTLRERKGSNRDRRVFQAPPGGSGHRVDIQLCALFAFHGFPVAERLSSFPGPINTCRSCEGRPTVHACV